MAGSLAVQKVMDLEIGRKRPRGPSGSDCVRTACQSRGTVCSWDHGCAGMYQQKRSKPDVISVRSSNSERSARRTGHGGCFCRTQGVGRSLRMSRGVRIVNETGV